MYILLVNIFSISTTMEISTEYRQFDEINHLVSCEFGENNGSFREIVGTITGETVRTVVSPSDKFIILKAEMNGCLAGTVTVRVRTLEYFIMYLVVSRNFRRMGVARKLLEHVFERFPGRVTRISCMDELQGMYAKFGFREISQTLSGIRIMERDPTTTSEPSSAGKLPYAHKFLNKASLATLDLDFYPESHFHGRYNMIHAIEEYKIIKPVGGSSGAGVGILQPGAKTYYSADNCISQAMISPHLDEGGYKYDIMTRVFVSDSGTTWMHEETFKRRCLERFDKNHISFANTSRLSSWSKFEIDDKTFGDIGNIIQNLITRVYDKLFGDDYSHHQMITLVMMYEDNGKLWLLECGV